VLRLLVLAETVPTPRPSIFNAFGAASFLVSIESLLDFDRSMLNALKAPPVVGAGLGLRE
jgi:hypothetical protein